MELFRALAQRWREEAERLERYGSNDRAAAACRVCAADLEDAIRAAESELLKPAEAAEYAGVTERTLRTWRADGRLTNHGTDTRPLYARGELPRRGSTSPSVGGYDPHADALRIAS